MYKIKESLLYLKFVLYVFIQNTLCLFLNQDIVFIKRQADGVSLEVLHFATSVYKSTSGPTIRRKID